MSSNFARLGMVGNPSTEPTLRPRYMGSHPNSHADSRRVYERLGRNYATSGRKGPATPLQRTLHINPPGPEMQVSTGSSVPTRGPFIPADAELRSINQRELLAAILVIRIFLKTARSSHVQLISDSQVTLAVTKNWTSRSPRLMALLRILRQLCENNGISLGLQYLQSVVNIWADKLSRRRDTSDCALTPTVIKHIQKQLTATVTQVYARRENVIAPLRCRSPSQGSPNFLLAQPQLPYLPRC
jgi:hypothetical protein